MLSIAAEQIAKDIRTPSHGGVTSWWPIVARMPGPQAIPADAEVPISQPHRHRQSRSHL